MGKYYKYNFVSAEPTFAIVKEELKSYFDTGAVDDLLFPTYVNKCLSKLGRGTLPIREVPIVVEDFQATLPQDFQFPREVWFCAELDTVSASSPTSLYTQATDICSVRVYPVTTDEEAICRTCGSGACPEEGGDDCISELEVYKSQPEIIRSFKQLFLLKPGNVAAYGRDGLEYKSNISSYGMTPGSSTYDSFDIKGEKLVTTFRKGIIHLIYYSDGRDDRDSGTLIPDDYRIQEYIELFLKYKTFETVFNQTHDETYNQVERKMMTAKQLADEAFILASIEMKKETLHRKVEKIKNEQKRFRKFERMVPTFNVRMNSSRY